MTGSRLHEFSAQLAREISGLETSIANLRNSLDGKPSNAAQLEEMIATANANLAETKFAKEGVDGLIAQLDEPASTKSGKAKVLAPAESAASGTRPSGG